MSMEYVQKLFTDAKIDWLLVGLSFVVGSAIGTLLPIPRREWWILALGLFLVGTSYLLLYLRLISADTFGTLHSVGIGIGASFMLIPPYQKRVDSDSADEKVQGKANGVEEATDKPEVSPAPQDGR